MAAELMRISKLSHVHLLPATFWKQQKMCYRHPSVDPEVTAKLSVLNCSPSNFFCSMKWRLRE